MDGLVPGQGCTLHPCLVGSRPAPCVHIVLTHQRTPAACMLYAPSHSTVSMATPAWQHHHGMVQSQTQEIA
jgi:hypothetical protein